MSMRMRKIYIVSFTASAISRDSEQHPEYGATVVSVSGAVG